MRFNLRIHDQSTSRYPTAQVGYGELSKLVRSVLVLGLPRPFLIVHETEAIDVSLQPRYYRVCGRRHDCHRAGEARFLGRVETEPASVHPQPSRRTRRAERYSADRAPRAEVRGSAN